MAKQKIDLSNVTAVVPIAGMGTRLKPHTHTLPKVLLRVADKPILGHVLDNIKKLGIKKIVLVVGQMREHIYNYIEKEYKTLDIEYVPQNELKGLGHAVYLARNKVKGPVFILLGDTILDINFKKAFSRGESWIGVKEVKDPRRFGVVEIKNGYISHLLEKPENPPTNLAIVGVYYIKNSESLFRSLETNIKNNKTTKGEIQLTDALESMIRKGEKFYAEEIDGWYDCGKPETLLSTNKFLLGKYHNKPKVISGSTICPPVYISPTALIINSVIGPYVSIGDEAKLENVIIQNSIIHKGAKVSNMVLSSSLIGYRAVFNGWKNQINLGDSSEINLRGVDEENGCPKV
ncbi:MAG: sugar phosphate nucleotidyltransferase [bacterium]|nr:sugar phosphate nucleotidyltransferase [bacterium]